MNAKQKLPTIPIRPKRELPPAPAHLRTETQAWWTKIVDEYDLPPHALRILETACDAFDRMLQAREALAKDGPVFTNRFGEPRTHPSVAIERDSRLAFIRATRELNLDLADDAPRAPGLK
jgi:P27 family predicted phage terminase small subunit